MSTVISLKDVSVVRGGKPILDRIDWTVEANQRWVIIGPNGAGKTTMLRIAAAQIHPTVGSAEILGERLGEVNVFELRTRIGFASSALASHIPNSEKVLDAVMTASYAITGRWNEKYEDIEMPANTYYGFIIMVMASGFGFGLVWHMWWLAIASLLGAIATAIIYAFLPQRNRIIPAAEVREIDEAWRRAARESVGVTRDDECKEANQGLARPDIITNP